MIHYMKLNHRPFDLMLKKEKTIELRLNDEKRQDIKKGDLIVFNNHQAFETKLAVKVINIHHFDSFESLYKNLDLKKCGYLESELGDASPNDMLSYYSREKELKYGVLGIEIRVIE